jgi:5'-nucleotidase/UDP-sugar diphosphatase
VRHPTRFFLAAAIALVSLAPSSIIAQQEAPTSPRMSAPLTFLQLNDVYTTLPFDDVGGLARVATLKKTLAAAGRTPFFVLAGDFLSPSVASSIFKGEQMIATLNSAGVDLGTLGNHEFDFGIDTLRQRMAEAKWQWVVSNVIEIKTGKPIGGAAPYVVRTFGPLKVGFIGLVLATSEISPQRLEGQVRILDPLEAAATTLPLLKKESVDVIVAVTHLAMADDLALAERFPEIDLIIGGHEHYPLTGSTGRTFISKAGSDARFVGRIDINRRAGGPVERYFELIPITAAIPDDEATAATAAAYESKLSAELTVVVGTTRVPLDADVIRLRSAEANLGNLFADVFRADTGADVAIVNSGSIRGDRVYPAGPIARRTLVEMHPFGGVICKVEVAGRVVLQALNNGVAKYPASAGQFPQVSGLTMRVDGGATGDRIRDVRVNGQPLDLERSYTVAIPDYMLLGGDDYTMFVGQRTLTDAESGNLIVSALEKYIGATGEIAPAIESRIVISR